MRVSVPSSQPDRRARFGGVPPAMGGARVTTGGAWLSVGGGPLWLGQSRSQQGSARESGPDARGFVVETSRCGLEVCVARGQARGREALWWGSGLEQSGNWHAERG